MRTFALALGAAIVIAGVNSLVGAIAWAAIGGAIALELLATVGHRRSRRNLRWLRAQITLKREDILGEGKKVIAKIPVK